MLNHKYVTLFKTERLLLMARSNICCGHSFVQRFVHCTGAFLHPELSSSKYPCLHNSRFSVHGESYTIFLHPSIFLWVFPSISFPVVPIPVFSLSVCRLAFSSHVLAIVTDFLQLLLVYISVHPKLPY